MSAPADNAEPTHRQDATIEQFADALSDLLQARARSCGIIDFAIDVESWTIAAEMMFTTDPDMGVLLDMHDGGIRYCVLIGDDSQRWLDDAAGTIVGVGEERDTDALQAQVLGVLDGLLAARRPLLERRDTPPK